MVLTNAAPIGVAEAIAVSFLDLATAGAIQRDWVAAYGQAFAAVVNAPNYGKDQDYSVPPTNPIAARPLGDYAGRYANDYVGEVEIVQSGGELVMRLGPLKAPFTLRHWNGDVFLYQPVGENAYGPARVTFAPGPAGRFETVTIENLNINKGGVLRRVG